MKTISSIVCSGVFGILTLPTAFAAAAPVYKVDLSFGQNEIKATPVCVAMDAKDQLYVLLQDGTVVLYDTAGKTTGGFKADMQPAPSTMAVADGRIYLLGTVMAEQTREF